jgi:hypothetical protein
MRYLQWLLLSWIEEEIEESSKHRLEAKRQNGGITDGGRA